MPELASPDSKPKRILFLSNGHGEDLNATLVLQALARLDPSLDILALPIVGAGQAYRKLGVPLIAPTQVMPSGGFVYMNPLKFLTDLGSGLIALTLRQLAALRRSGATTDLVIAVGDVVPMVMAHLTGRPYVVFLVSTSSYYEGRIRMPWLAWWLLHTRRCVGVLTRDAFTATDLQCRGLTKATFEGYPIMDMLDPQNRSWGILSGVPMIALLPGSRVPEATRNLGLLMDFCREVTQVMAGDPVEFRAALVPSLTESVLVELAQEKGWVYGDGGDLWDPQLQIRIGCSREAFAEVLQCSQLVVGMAGTAIEQAVGLGKPVMQIPGSGPQFTYRFAEAQMRLLGPSVQTFLTPAAAAQAVPVILADLSYHRRCQANGLERVGKPGGSQAIAAYLNRFLT